MAKLVFLSPSFDGRVYHLELEKTTVGRGDQNTLVIQDSSLSSAHCEILVHEPEVIVRDLGSRNGTVVNGKKLRDAQAQLKHGQIVRFGTVEARLELELNPEDQTAGLTAIHQHARAVRDLEHPHPVPDPFVKMGQESAMENADHTAFLSATRPGAPLVSAQAGPPTPAGTAEKGSESLLKRVVLPVGAILALGLVLAIGLVRLIGWLSGNH